MQGSEDQSLHAQYRILERCVNKELLEHDEVT